MSWKALFALRTISRLFSLSPYKGRGAGSVRTEVSMPILAMKARCRSTSHKGRGRSPLGQRHGHSHSRERQALWRGCGHPQGPGPLRYRALQGLRQDLLRAQGVVQVSGETWDSPGDRCKNVRGEYKNCARICHGEMGKNLPNFAKKNGAEKPCRAQKKARLCAGPGNFPEKE